MMCFQIKYFRILFEMSQKLINFAVTKHFIYLDL